MIRAALAAVLLLVTSCLYAQAEIDIGQPKPTPDEVLSAEQLIVKAKDAPVRMPLGGYVLAKITYTGPLTYYAVPGSDKCIKIKLIPKGETYEGFLVPAGGTEYVDTIIPADPKNDRLLIRGTMPSAQATALWIANGKTPTDGPVVVAGYQFIVGDPPPKPPGPVPPKPVDPPIVTPTGLRVILVYNPDDNMTAEQIAMLNSPKIEEYLNSHCAKDEKGRPSWRRWSKSVDVSKETQLWKKAWEAVKPQLGPLPQVAIITDQSGKTYPFPENEAALLTLLQSIGGK